MLDLFRLYSWKVSLYSGKARSYLTKQRINFEDVSPAHPDFEAKVRPAIGRWIIPVMVTPEDEIIQDGTDIIDWFEDRGLSTYPAYPNTPRHLITSLIMEMFGGEGMVKPAMHYRWNFDEVNADFILQQFGLFAMPQMPEDQRQDMAIHASGRMRKAAVAMGVNKDTIPLIEASYEQLLSELNEHFSAYPYLLGGHPTIGDYGLIASLYAHLGRDPYPLALMQRKAPMLYRWTERMNCSHADMIEFVNMPESLVSQDDIADSLKTILKHVAKDYLPEIKAMVEYTNQWLDTNPVEAGAVVNNAVAKRSIGMTQFPWEGQMVDCAVMPYRFYLLQRIQGAYDDLPSDEKASVDALLKEVGLQEILTVRTNREVERKNNAEVWGNLV